MAAVSAPQASGSSLTPPTSSHSNWDFAVPANARSSQDYAYSSKEPLPSDYDRDKRHMAPIANTSRARPSRSNSHDQQAHLAPRVAALHPKSNPIGTSNPPSDSLVDLYANSSKSGSTSLHNEERSVVTGGGGNKRASVAMLDEDDPGWIHRDKLARIESRELQAAGIILPRNRAYSKTGRSNRSRETSASGTGQRGQQRRPHVERGQSHAEEDLDQEMEMRTDGAEDNAAWDFRSPEEIEADNSYAYDRSILAKGASKIPLAMTSRLPVPMDYVTRDKPAQRQKSGAWGSDGENASIEYPRPPARAASVEPEAPQPSSAPVLLPPPPKAQRDSGGGGSTPGKRNTQSATHSPTKNGPGNVRKSNTTAKTPPISNQHGGNGRPKTRSGSTSQSRPVTRGTGEVKRPEGDPPWLATMFKPDPRLPPDQQLLPTVAKRLAQENWEKEGKGGTCWDRNFRPLNDEELRRQELPPSPTKSDRDRQLQVEIPTGANGNGEWPLRSPDKEGRPSTAGGYSTMPKISDQPPPRQAPMIQPNPPKVEPMEEEPKVKKGGCGCCIVM